MSTRTLQDLIPYLFRHKDVGLPPVADYTVAIGYVIEYNGNPVTGIWDDQLNFGEKTCAVLKLKDVDWNYIQIYKRMNNW